MTCYDYIKGFSLHYMLPPIYFTQVFYYCQNIILKKDIAIHLMISFPKINIIFSAHFR